jgi:GTPase involved in cell partitioning and DNA repair
MEKFYVEKEQQPPPPREREDISLVAERLDSYQEIWQVVGDTPAQKSFADGSQAVALVELTEAGQAVVLCQGGFGGKGNFLFRGSTNVTPLEVEYGSLGNKKR